MAIFDTPIPQLTLEEFARVNRGELARPEPPKQVSEDGFVRMEVFIKPLRLEVQRIGMHDLFVHEQRVAGFDTVQLVISGLRRHPRRQEIMDRLLTVVMEEAGFIAQEERDGG